MASRIADLWQTEIMGQEAVSHPGKSLLRGLATGGAHLYERGLDAYLNLENVGVRRREKLPIPVVSIGNLTVGGTGKTPMTRFLCQRLTDQGKRLAVLSRGHGGKGSGTRLVSDAHGNIARGVADAGDEPLLLAQSLPGIPVLVGKDRRLSGREAMRRFALDALVLDDGFQYWQLARDLDIVLLDASLPFDNGECLPRGLLREPPRHLSRSSLVVATRADHLEETARHALRARVKELAPAADLYYARHRASGLIALGALPFELLPLKHLEGQRVVAWSAIARPESFLQSLEASTGVCVAEHMVYPDHYSPTQADVSQVEDVMRTHKADAVIMTEKDAVKWPDTGKYPAYSLCIEMHVEEESVFLDAVSHHLFGRQAS